MIKRKMLDGENVIGNYKIHWLILLKIILVLAIVILFGFITYEYYPNMLNNFVSSKINLLVLLLFSIFLLKAFFIWAFSSFTLTNKRLILKQGLIIVSEREILFNKIESVDIVQNIMEKVFGVGTLVISGTGTNQTILENVANVEEFRDALSSNLKSN